jgi:hypothetical protein
MAWIITNNNNSITFDDGSISYDIQKTDISLKEDGKTVFVFVDNQQLRGFKKLEIDFNDVSSPVATSSSNLRETLTSYINSSSSEDLIDELSSVAIDSSRAEVTLNDILEEIKLTNKLLKKIYNPE